MPHPIITGLVTDVYWGAAAVTGYVAIPDGMILGQAYYDERANKQWAMCNADAAIVANRAVKTDPSGTAGQYYNIIPTAATTDFLLGIAETALPNINNAGWVVVSGVGSCLVVNGTAQGALIGTTATSGQLGAVGTHVRAQCLTAPGGAPAVVPCFLI